MKISKSKQELARIISENGGWWNGAEYSAMDTNGMVCGYLSVPKWITSLRGWVGTECFRMFLSKTPAPNHQRTILSRAEYFHLYPALDADGWIEWNGDDDAPVSGEVFVDVKHADGDIESCCAGDINWGWENARWDIIAYRLRKPEQAKPEFCESVMLSIPEPEAKPSIEQLAADYRKAKDYAESKRKEADAAKDNAEEKLKALELAGEAIGLKVSPITAKQEPEW